MKKLFIPLTALLSLSVNASVISKLVDSIEVNGCKKSLIKDLKSTNASIKYDLRYLNSLQSYPALHVFAVYEDQSAEPLDLVKMVKHHGKKCERY